MGISELEDMATRGLALMMTITSAVKLLRTSCVGRFNPDCVESRRLLATPIIRSHMGMFEGLNTH